MTTTSTAELLAMPRRPITGWEGLYEVTKSGQVYSVRTARFIAWERDEQNRPFIEVSVHQVKFQRSIWDAVAEAWDGDTSQILEIRPALTPLDRTTLKLYDHVYGTYQPSKHWGKPRRYATDVGKRSLFQVAGAMTKEELRHHRVTVSDTAMSWRDLPGLPRFEFARCPLSHLVDLERAPAEAGKYVPGAPPA